MFKGVKSTADLPKLEHRILKFWKDSGAFEKRVALNRGKKHWSFIDGPITANNPMGVHHAWGRTYKDVFQRYRAMNGFELRYQNGFDCQASNLNVTSNPTESLSSLEDASSEPYVTLPCKSNSPFD